MAQETAELITTALPFPDYRTVQRDHYGLRLGPVMVRYDLSLSAVYTDNRNYNESGLEEEDFGLRPVFHLGLFYPINDRQKLQLDVGVGYQWWMNRDNQNRFYISPSSHVDYRFFLGDVQMRVSNNTSSSSEASDRAEYAGGGSTSDLNFNRLSNVTALNASWGTRRVSFSGGYSYAITRGLDDDTSSLDRDTHGLNASALVTITAPLAAGVSATYSTFSYLEQVQNDGETWSVGPTAEWRPMDSLSLNGYVHYSESTYERTGTISDNSDFSGIVFGFTARHQLNRYVSHSATFSKDVDPGYGSNFTDTFSVLYAVNGRISDRLGANLAFTYRKASISGSLDEDADLYRISVGTGYQVLRALNVGLTYSLNTRQSNIEDREYVENRVTMVASYKF